MPPILSIVIANYNYGRFLEEAIQSVIAQNVGDQVELIICDAASTDNSVDIIKKYANGLPPNTLRSEWNNANSKLQTANDRLITWWCSEKDGGQSQAFNKGFSHARGGFLTWLNADDLLMPNVLARVIQEIKQHKDCQWFTGNFLRFTEDRHVIEIGYGPHIYPKILQRHNSPLVVFGPTTFFSREILQAVGGINETYHYAMDTDLWLKFQTNGIKQRRVNAICWAFRMHDESKTAEFGTHRLSKEIADRLRREVLQSYESYHYKPSYFIQLIMYGLRILDGSFLKRMLLRLSVRELPQSNETRH